VTVAGPSYVGNVYGKAPARLSIFRREESFNPVLLHHCRRGATTWSRTPEAFATHTTAGMVLGVEEALSLMTQELSHHLDSVAFEIFSISPA